eukprot:Awhi_evm1s11119
MTSHSIWLVLEDKNGQTQQCIDELSTLYQAPRFSPHVTVVGSLANVEESDIVNKTEKAVKTALESISHDAL